MSKIDEIAECQLRILGEYSVAGSSTIDRLFTFWISILTTIFGLLVGLRLGGGAPQNPLLLAAVIVVVIVVWLQHKHGYDRGREIEKALSKLSNGRPIADDEFAKILERISKHETT